MLMKELLFTTKESVSYSDAVLCGQEGMLTFSIKMADESVHKVLVQHSIDNENWQNLGVTEFVSYTEFTIDGIRPELQYVRVCMLDGVTPSKASVV